MAHITLSLVIHNLPLRTWRCRVRTDRTHVDRDKYGDDDEKANTHDSLHSRLVADHIDPQH
jgi:hypothetical protein